MEPQASNKHCQPHHFCQAVMVNVAFFHQMDLLSEKLSKQTLQAKFFQPAWVVNYPEAEVQKFKYNLIDPCFLKPTNLKIVNIVFNQFLSEGELDPNL